MTHTLGFVDKLRSAGIGPADSNELRLQKSLLVFATGLITFASMLWLLIYWQLGPQLSSTLPFLFQILLVGNLLIFLKTEHFQFFRQTQLALFLFMPFVVQWSMGTIITASGISLWALLAPIGALLCIGTQEAIAWFFAYLFFTFLSAGFDYYLADFSIKTLSKTAQISTQTTVIFFALNFAAVSSIAFLLLRFSTDERRKTQKDLEEAHHLLQQEQERSERLLLNILPDSIATRLKQSNQTIADGFAEVSVMFVDIVNFTQIAEGLSPKEVFRMLNQVFSHFDELAESYEMEKIKTIGDAYMVAGGLNTERKDYTSALLLLADAMRSSLLSNPELSQHHLDVRIGIGTGPVVAGVVGKKKFIYDLWGDTVNLASRITSEGSPGQIQVDTTTYQRLKNEFSFYPPCTIFLKGKGDTQVFRFKSNKATP